jgi:hypothetical protein
MLLGYLRTFIYSRYIEPTKMRRRYVVAYLTVLSRHSQVDIQENYKTSIIISHGLIDVRLVYPFRKYSYRQCVGGISPYFHSDICGTFYII